jgi:hypothetical protein
VPGHVEHDQIGIHPRGGDSLAAVKATDVGHEGVEHEPPAGLEVEIPVFVAAPKS